MVAPRDVYAFDLTMAEGAAANWRVRTEVRSRQTQAAAAGHYVEAESLDDEAKSRERLAKWINRNLAHVDQMLPAGRDLPERVSDLVDRRARRAFEPDEIDDQLVERVIGATRDFLAVAFLERAVQATRSVGRIETRLTGGRRSYGTGFLVSARLLLTNNHVLPTRTQATSSIVEFDYQLDFRDQPLTIERFELEPQAFYLTNRGLDFTLVAVKPTSLAGRLLEEYGWCPLIKEEGKIRITEPVNIVQHPRGEMKQVVIRENKLLDLLDPQPMAHYSADTEPGSSGSPVFNDRWEVIALHHSGVPATDPEDNKLDVDGNIWQQGDDPNRLKWAANEGIRVSRLVRFVEQAEIQPHEVALKAALLAASQPPGVGRPGLTRVEVGDEAPVMPAVASSAPNAVSITVPLQITVSLGAAAPSGEADLGQPELEAIQPDPDYANRPGYKKDFLGFDVPLPDLGDAIAGQAVVVDSTSGRFEVKYYHFSVIMSGERRLAFFAAVNHDPDAPFVQKREGKDRWFFDPRILRAEQAGNEVYSDNPLDRGHLVRRADAAWGMTAAEAKLANDDTFHFTNCSPQHEVFNQATKANKKGLLLWGNIEEHIASQADVGNRRLCIFNGPVFRTDDRAHRGLPIPREFWKVVAYRRDDGSLAAVAFLLSQLDLIKNLPPEEFVIGPYEPFQVKLQKIEELTGLSFGGLNDVDPLNDDGNERFFMASTDFVPLGRLSEIVL